MEAKDTAQELVSKFSSIGLQQREEGLQCALICADEIIKQWEYIDTYLSDFGGKLNPNLKHWHQVKEELNKLWEQ